VADQSPSSVLRQAAAKVREMAGEALPGPWIAEFVPDDNETWFVQTEEMPPWNVAKDVMGPGNALWIKCLSPAIAEPLAALLDAIAADIAGFTPGFADDFPEVHLARLILEASDG